MITPIHGEQSGRLEMIRGECKKGSCSVNKQDSNEKAVQMIEDAATNVDTLSSLLPLRKFTC